MGFSKKLLVLVSIVFSVSFSSCLKSSEPTADDKARENDEAIQAHLVKNGITAQKTVDGIYYVITKTNPTGKVATNGDLMQFQYLTSRLDGFRLDSSTAAKPAYSPLGTVNNLWSYLGSLMKEGEKIKVFLPYTLGYGAEATTNLPAYSPIQLDFAIEKIRNEDEQIDNYIADNKWVTKKTSSGLRYIITSPIAAADSLKKGQKVTLKYTGKLLYYSAIAGTDGKITNTFDSGSFSFTLGNGEVVAGFDEGVSKFKVGEKGVILFPSALGYKDVAQSKIPAKSPLMFEIEIVSAQ
jgi:FKBP-type peptidyl-prolyl cis-trans isomerase